MSDFSLVLSSLKSRWLNASLSVFLTAFGVMLALLVIQFGHHIQNRLSADGKGIDIVIGAKGSPLQVILSSVYHIDIPTGNISYEEAQKWIKHRHVRTAIPLALGDNWKGYRIVGTTTDYIDHYQATLKNGRTWNRPFEAVVGVNTDLNTGDTFVGAHGLTEGSHVHEQQKFKVVGVIETSGTVIDRLILTSLDSVLKLHGQEGVEYDDDDHNHDHKHDHHDHHHGEHSHGHASHEHTEEHSSEAAGEPEITALLLKTKSPIANINLPRSINRTTSLQAANPALEMARLTSMLGLGSQSFTALSILLIIIAALSIFVGLAGSLENRLSDLAVLRAIGYSKSRVFKIITFEGLIIVGAGTALGFIMGIGGFLLLSDLLPPLSVSDASIYISIDFLFVFLAVFCAGFIASIWPALRASKVDVARLLSQNT